MDAFEIDLSSFNREVTIVKKIMINGIVKEIAMPGRIKYKTINQLKRK